MVKVRIIEIICVVHSNDIAPDWIPHVYTCHCLGSYFHNNTQYPIFVVMEGLNNDQKK